MSDWAEEQAETAVGLIYARTTTREEAVHLLVAMLRLAESRGVVNGASRLSAALDRAWATQKPTAA